ncbi:MAG: GAF domain-containing protein [Chloroflexi bacterium]|nr:GAF domain-containing protein [Chloroflexota bacterium]
MTIEPSLKFSENTGQRVVNWLIKPSDSIQSPEGKRQAQLMSGLTLATIVLTGIRVVIGFRSGSYLEDEGFFLYYLLLSAMFFAYIFSRTKHITFSTLIFVFAFTGLVYGIVLVRGSTNPLDNLNTLIWVLPGFTFGAVLFSYWVSFGWMVLNFVALLLLPRFYPGLDSSVLTGLVFTIFVLIVLNMVLNHYRQQIEQDRQKTILKANRDLQILNSSLEERVSERTKALQATTEVSRRLSTILDRDELVKEVVEQVQSTFDYYHVHIYLFDEGRQNLLMVGGTGEVGQVMLKRGHMIPLESGLVGRSARMNQVVLVPDTGLEPGWLANTLLPETKSEVAVPITFGERVRGVLDVQHNIVNGLTQNDADLLQSVANQVAIAIQNARQYGQAQESEGRLRAMIDAIPTGVMITRIKDGLVQYANDNAAAIFAYPLPSLIGNITPNLYYNARDRETISNILQREGSLTNYEVLGRQQDGSPIWVALSVQSMIYAGEPSFFINATDIRERKQTAEALSKRAEQDRVLNRISTKIRGAVSVEQILQVATQELRQATGASRSTMEIAPSEQTVEFSRD